MFSIFGSSDCTSAPDESFFFFPSAHCAPESAHRALPSYACIAPPPPETEHAARKRRPKAPTACTDKSEKIAPWLVLRKR